MFEAVSFCLVSADSVDNQALQNLAIQLQKPVLAQDDPAVLLYTYCLLADETGLQLMPVNKKSGGPLFVSFATAQVQRRQQAGIRQTLARAAGCKAGFRPNVLDATAGFAADAFVLAGLGCKVTLLENHPLVYAMLDDALSRALQGHCEQGRIVSGNMRLLAQQNALEYLAACSELWDTIYLDPMFPERTKTAKVKKKMQYLHDLVGFAPDQEEQLLALAIKRAGKRVVVKRPLRAPALAGQSGDLQMCDKTIRYDVYLCQ